MVHVVYFGFGIASLLVLSLLIPRQTPYGPLILAGGAVLWAASATARYLWERQYGDSRLISLEPAHLFLVVLISTYIVFSFDLSTARPQLSSATPDALPGLSIDSHAYFVLVLIYLLAFVGWYGSERGRLLETALAVQVLLLSLMFESFLYIGDSVPVLVLMAVGLALVRALPWEGEARAVDRSIIWIALPLFAFLVAAALSTMFGGSPYTSQTTTTRVAVMAFIALLLFDSVRNERQRWLIWLAMTAPAVTQAALVTVKLLDIARVMGFSYAFGNRIQLTTGIDPNPLGLSLAVGTLLVAAALPVARGAAMRLIAGIALALLLPAFVVAYSVPAISGLAFGLACLTVLYLCRSNWRAWRRPATFAAPATFVVIGLVVAALYLVPAATRNGLRYTIDDPTTGRSRANIWSWSVRDFKEHPLLGVGPGFYRGRVKHVPTDFPFRDVTKMLERRRLLFDDPGQWHVLVFTHPHNLVLSVAEGMGIVGLAALAALAAVTILTAYRVIVRRGTDEWWFTGLGLALLVTTFVWSMTALGNNVAMLPLAGWLGLGFIAIAHRSGAGRPLAVPRFLAGERTRRAVATVAALAVVTLFVGRPIASSVALKIGRDRVASGDLRGAERALRVGAALEPLDASAPLSLSFPQLQFGKTEDALASLKESDSRQPNNPVVLGELGDVAWLLGDTNAAERYYRRGIESDPWLAIGRDTYSSLALLKLAEGQPDEATRLFAQGFFVSPANVFNAAWIHSEDGSSVRLDDVYFQGSDPRTNVRLAEALDQRLRIYVLPSGSINASAYSITRIFDEMERQAKDELTRNRARGIEMLDQLATCYRYAQLYDGARRVFSEAAALDPTATYIRYDLAQTDIALKDDDAAARDLKEVVRLARASGVYDLRLSFAQRDLAFLAFRQKRYQDATVLMRDALASYRWGYMPFALTTLADAYSALGQEDKANEYRRKERYLTH